MHEIGFELQRKVLLTVGFFFFFVLFFFFLKLVAWPGECEVVTILGMHWLTARASAIVICVASSECEEQ